LVELLFLGSGLLIFGLLTTAAIAALAKARRTAKQAAAGAVLLALGSAAILLGVALCTRDITLTAGGRKYFCEADCHIAYEVKSVASAATLGPEGKLLAAHGQFMIVRLKTLFDEKTIAPFRGNSPLTPDRRIVKLVDERGRQYWPDTSVGGALRQDSTPLTEALRPGESYETTVVFDLPNNVHAARLLIADSEPVTRLLVDHENSPLHGKIYLALEPGEHSVNR
jgi:hypothetical protein